MHPEETPTTSLQAGQVGYIACNMKVSSEGRYWLRLIVLALTLLSAHIGDTIHRTGEPVEPMVAFQPTKAMVSLRKFRCF